jgi:hypothetical protein
MSAEELGVNERILMTRIIEDELPRVRIDLTGSTMNLRCIEQLFGCVDPHLHLHRRARARSRCRELGRPNGFVSYESGCGASAARVQLGPGPV